MLASTGSHAKGARKSSALYPPPLSAQRAGSQRPVIQLLAQVQTDASRASVTVMAIRDIIRFSMLIPRPPLAGAGGAGHRAAKWWEMSVRHGQTRAYH